MFNMITKINESKTFTKQISCECECKFDGRKCNSNQRRNNDKCRCECKKHHICEKVYIWNPATCSCKNGKYLANTMNEPVITSDEIIEKNEEAKTVPTNFNEKNITCKTQNYVFHLPFINYNNIIDSC